MKTEGAALRAAIAACLLLPWVWPWAPGPSTAVGPWLAGATCGVALGFLTRGAMSRTFALALVLVLPLAAWRAISPLEPAALDGALVLIAFAAGAGARAVQERRTRLLLVRVWWVAAALSTAMALLQYFGVAGPLAPWVSATEAGTAYANLRQRNQFATLTAIGLAALLWETRRSGRVAWVAPLAAWLAIGNAASGSRTGLVELLALGALVLVWPGRSRAQAIVAGTAIVAFAVAAITLPALLRLAGVEGVSLWERVSAPGACGSRSVLWSNVATLIRDRPWAGWGWGELDYAHFQTLYPGARFCDILDNAHDLPLHLAVEFGVPIALLVCGAALYAVVRARAWREADSTRQLAWSVVAMVAMHSLLEYPLWYAPFQLAFGVAVGMLWPGDARAWPGAARWLAPALFAGAVGYATWDYLRVSQIYLAPEDRLAGYREDTVGRIRKSWLFREYAAFAELTITPLTRANAQWTYETALAMVHYSPEPRVVEKIVESATMLGHIDVAVANLARFRAAFPKEHAEWAKGQRFTD